MVKFGAKREIPPLFLKSSAVWSQPVALRSGRHRFCNSGLNPLGRNREINEQPRGGMKVEHTRERRNWRATSISNAAQSVVPTIMIAYCVSQDSLISYSPLLEQLLVTRGRFVDGPTFMPILLKSSMTALYVDACPLKIQSLADLDCLGAHPFEGCPLRFFR